MCLLQRGSTPSWLTDLHIYFERKTFSYFCQWFCKIISPMWESSMTYIEWDAFFYGLTVGMYQVFTPKQKKAKVDPMEEVRNQFSWIPWCRTYCSLPLNPKITCRTVQQRKSRRGLLVPAAPHQKTKQSTKPPKSKGQSGNVWLWTGRAPVCSDPGSGGSSKEEETKSD